MIILLCAHCMYYNCEYTEYTLKAVSVTRLLVEASHRCVTAGCYWCSDIFQNIQSGLSYQVSSHG